MRKLCCALMIAVVVATSAGCSAYMAANQPGQKDLGLLSPGQPRAKLIAEFGQPLHSEIKNGTRHDIFQFTQGYHGGVKAARAVGHATASVLTLGLWEVVGTPTEGYLNGTQLSVEVVYDGSDRVATVTPLKGEDEIRRGVASTQLNTAPVSTGSVRPRPEL